MEKNGYIEESEKENAINTELIYTKTTERKNLSTIMYYQDAVISELKTIKSILIHFLETGGLKNIYKS